MERKLIIRALLKAIDIEDIVIIVGSSYYNDVDDSVDRKIVYVNYDNSPIGIAIGMSLFTNRNVYIFVDDFLITKDLGDLLSAAATGNKNIRIVLLHSGNYAGIEYFKLITSNINSVKSIFFNMGFLIHDYSRCIKNGIEEAVNEIGRTLSNTRSPLMIISPVEVEYKECNIDFSTVVEKSIDIVKNSLSGEDYGL